MKYNFGGFTAKGNEALNNAILSAERLGHTYIGSEHLLLGLLMTGSGAAFTVLSESGAHLADLERLVTETVGRGIPTDLSPEHFSPRAKRVVENSIAGNQKNGQ